MYVYFFWFSLDSLSKRLLIVILFHLVLYPNTRLAIPSHIFFCLSFPLVVMIVMQTQTFVSTVTSRYPNELWFMSSPWNRAKSDKISTRLSSISSVLHRFFSRFFSAYFHDPTSMLTRFPMKTSLCLLEFTDGSRFLRPYFDQRFILYFLANSLCCEKNLVHWLSLFFLHDRSFLLPCKCRSYGCLVRFSSAFLRGVSYSSVHWYQFKLLSSSQTQVLIESFAWFTKNVLLLTLSSLLFPTDHPFPIPQLTPFIHHCIVRLLKVRAFHQRSSIGNGKCTRHPR